MPTLNSNKKIQSGYYWLLPLFLLVIAQAVFIYLYLILPQGPFCWDEAHRSVFSLMVAKSLISGNFSMLWQLTNQQIYWPFLHSWASSIFLIIGGFSYPAARTMSLTMNAGALITIYFIARKVTDRGGGVVGLIAAGLFALSPIFTFFAATAMAESLGIFLSLLVLLSYLTAWQKSSWRWYLLSGVFLALLYFTKYIYAIFFGFGIFLFWLSFLFNNRERVKLQTNLRQFWIMPVAFGVCLFLWMLGGHAGDKIGILAYRFRDTGGWDYLKLGLMKRILFYPSAIFWVYTFSPWIFLSYICGLIWGFCNWRNLKVRLLLILFLSNLMPMSLSVNLQERFIATSIPCLFILTALFLTSLWNMGKRKWYWMVPLIWLILISGDLHKLPEYIRIIGNTTLGIMNYKSPKIRTCSTLFGIIDYPKFIIRQKNILLPQNQEQIPRHDLEDIYEFIWENTDPRGGICALFQLNEASPHLWRWHSLARNQPIFNNWNPNCYFFVSLSLSPLSNYRTMVNLNLLRGKGRTEDGHRFLEGLTQKGLLNVLKKRSYADMGMVITIYTRAIPVNDYRWRKILFN